MKKLIQSARTYIQTHKKTDLIFLGIGLAIFLTITLVNAPRASIWFDEAFTAYIAQFNFWDIARYTANDVHPPLYYWMAKVWVSLFGTTEIAFRSLSILFGSGAAVVAFFMSRKLFGRAVAWLSFVFMVLSPMLIRYSDEARMYTLAALLVFGATYLMIRAQETKKRSLWVWYGVLVSLGMWTHYFTAFVWVAHWIWWGMQKLHKSQTPKEFFKAVFSKEWILAYAVAVGLYLPWVPFMAYQLIVVQGSGFWIGPVGVHTPANYLTNYFYYLEHGQVKNWLATLLIAVVVIVVIALPKAYRALKAGEKRSFWLVSILAWAPPVLLFLASLPPVRPSFVERYLVPSIVALSIFLAVVLIAGTRTWRPFWRAVPMVMIVGMMIFGIFNVYKYGNYNKNSNTNILTRQAVEAARAASEPGVPIVTDSPWVFYEAIFYNTPEHPVYFIDANTNYNYGSLDMLKYNDQHKIKDLNAFEKEHPVIWYLGGTSKDEIPPFRDSWKKLETVRTYDPLNETSNYKATKYRVSEE